jgi:hypothetical protein
MRAMVHLMQMLPTKIWALDSAICRTQPSEIIVPVCGSSQKPQPIFACFPCGLEIICELMSISQIFII